MMGIIYNSKQYISEPKEYISKLKWNRPISHRRTVKPLTRKNIQFLKNIGLKIVRVGVA